MHIGSGISSRVAGEQLEMELDVGQRPGDEGHRSGKSLNYKSHKLMILTNIILIK